MTYQVGENEGFEIENNKLIWVHNLVDNEAVTHPVSIYLLKVNNRDTRAKCKICLKLTIKTPELRQWRRTGVFIVNFEHISHLVLVFLLLMLNPTGQATFIEWK